MIDVDLIRRANLTNFWRSFVYWHPVQDLLVLRSRRFLETNLKIPTQQVVLGANGTATLSLAFIADPVLRTTEVGSHTYPITFTSKERKITGTGSINVLNGNDGREITYPNFTISRIDDGTERHRDDVYYVHATTQFSYKRPYSAQNPANAMMVSNEIVVFEYQGLPARGNKDLDPPRARKINDFNPFGAYEAIVGGLVLTRPVESFQSLYPGANITVGSMILFDSTGSLEYPAGYISKEYLENNYPRWMRPWENESRLVIVKPTMIMYVEYDTIGLEEIMKEELSQPATLDQIYKTNPLAVAPVEAYPGFHLL